MTARTSRILGETLIKSAKSQSRFPFDSLRSLRAGLDSAELRADGRFCPARNDKVEVHQGILARAGGSEIAEAALVLPLAFLVLLGIYWFGRAFNVYATINHAAREGARYAVAQSCATCGNAAPTIDSIATQVGQAMQASGLNPSLAITDNVTHLACGGGTVTCAAAGGPGEPPIWYCTNVQLVAASLLPPASGGPVCGVSIDFQYPFQLPLPFTSLNGQQLNLSAHVQMKTEQ
jgi:hypothetical protein